MPKWLTAFLVASSAYFVAGKIGLLLSIPPGFASAVWPASGIALALVLRLQSMPTALGVATGSLLFNLGISTAGYTQISPTATLIALTIAVAAALQALAGRFLFLRFVGGFENIIEPAKLVHFAILVASLGCLVSSSISTSTLFLAGAIGLDLVSFTWLTWWAGDTLGVILFTPLVLVLTEKRQIFSGRRKVQVLAPMAIIFACVWVVFSYSLQRQATENHLKINAVSSSMALGIKESLTNAENKLKAYTAFFNGSESINHAEFNAFSAVMLGDDPTLRGIGWTPIVAHDERAAIEQRFRDQGFVDYRFTEFDSEGALQPATPMDEYFPVLYIYPLEENRQALGLNLAANPDRKAALLKARQLSKPVATPPITLAQGAEGQKATILYSPVFKLDGEAPAFLGYVSGVMHIAGLIGSAIADMEAAGLSIVLTDVTDPKQPLDLIRQAGPHMQGMEPSYYPARFGERDYRIELYANSSYQVGRDWSSWLVLTGGFFIAALLQIFIMSITGTLAHISREVERQTEDLRREKERADRANLAKSQFLANMSHELRTPLNGIIGLINLCRKTELSPQQANYLGNAALSSSTLLSLINQTLDFAKIEAGSMKLNHEPFSLRFILNKLQAHFSQAAKDKGIGFVIAIDGEVPDSVIGDALKLEQILLNLIGNAFKFTAQGEVSLSIGFDDKTQRFSFEIKDTGIGIPQELAGSLFKPFTQADASTTRQYGGTGLGLSISRELARMMKGDVELDTSCKTGCLFRVTVSLEMAEVGSLVKAAESPPIKQDEASSPLVPAANVEPAADGKPLGGRRLLLVEDNAINQMIAQELLQDFGAEVVVAANGRLALDVLAKRADIELILMDIQMPEMNGFEATEKIRAGGAYQDVPIIAMTANAMSQDVDDCLQAGMNAHIGKPIDANQLLAKIVEQLATTDKTDDLVRRV